MAQRSVRRARIIASITAGTVIHKAQGMTVDWAHVLATTPGMDRQGLRCRHVVTATAVATIMAGMTSPIRSAGCAGRRRGEDMASDYEA